MKPLSFKVKKLVEQPDALGLMEDVRDENWSVVEIKAEDLVNLSEKVLAYQLTPCGDYSDYANTHVTGFVIGRWHGLTNYYRFDGEVINLEISMNNPLQPFLIPAEHYNSFRDAVHSYNLKYCDVPDVKVLDGLIEYCHEQSEKWQGEDRDIEIQYKRTINTVEGYKATLVSPEMWFEMESE